MDEATRKLGPYTLVSKIGRGAFGVVWLAEKRSSIATTQFALKLPRDEDIDLDAFKQEATIWLQASGHPNVVPMIEADIYEDQVVIVSEYVTGGSLAAWLKQHDGRAPDYHSASELIEGVLAGLAHLHSRQIIHRDLKPDNILLQHETPRLTDFGIARLLKSGSYSTNVTGTLAYMAPEAFDGKRNEQTDIWSVGVIFYQLLAGRLPYDQPDTVSLVGAIMRHDPPSLPETVPEVLRRIVMRALAREPASRYAGAKDMRSDLREAEFKLWQGDQKTVTIEPEATLPARLPQPTVPHPQEAETKRIETEQTTDMLPPRSQPALAIKGKSPSRFRAAAIAGAVLIGIIAIAGIYLLARSKGNKGTTQAGSTNQTKKTSGQFALKQTLTGKGGVVYEVAFSPDGKTLASTNADKTVELWEVQTGSLKRSLTGHKEWVIAVAFSPDGKTLASGGSDATVRLWDPETGMARQTLTGHSDYVRTVAYSPDGKTIASASNDRTVKLWDAESGALKQTLAGHSHFVGSVAYSPDGQILASGGSDGKVILWDGVTGERKRTLNVSDPDAVSVKFSPDGKLLAAASEKAVKLFESQSGNLKQTLSGDQSFVDEITFSPDGETLACTSYFNMIKLWNVQTATLKQTLSDHIGPVHSIAFSPDGQTLASGGYDMTVRLWRLE